MAINHQPVTGSGRRTADAAVLATGGYLHGIMLENDGTNASSVIIYDNASAASGTVLAKVMLPASSAVLTQYVVFNNPVSVLNGIYVDVTGTGAAYIAYYSIGN